MPQKIKILFLVLVCFNRLQAQNSRLNDNNTIGWYNYFGTLKLDNKWGLVSEYQWRRNNLIADPQQNLLRVGINYQLHPNIQLRVGYALIETAAYGDIPINGFGKDFTEHFKWLPLMIIFHSLSFRIVLCLNNAG
jgi:hypothetical protein